MEITYEEFQNALDIVRRYKIELDERHTLVNKNLETCSKFINVTKDTSLKNANISTRLYNILLTYKDEEKIDFNRTVGELSKFSVKKLRGNYIRVRPRIYRIL